ncbi:histone-lysine N-methyltransferase ASHH1-like [Dorcoceras hygrometricum]|uniref:Histone-lysine N-methyltransferase ASHH1-like n=1 Tax=Dorcoceras hygrometricum TaxID=472368 RepID=A0A2Z7BQY1_9LAMI|nr:histone-lysine N-methyltransferase ASHH1-like [Dorcoceras hygrometricum]
MTQPAKSRLSDYSVSKEFRLNMNACNNQHNSGSTMQYRAERLRSQPPTQQHTTQHIAIVHTQLKNYHLRTTKQTHLTANTQYTAHLTTASIQDHGYNINALFPNPRSRPTSPGHQYRSKTQEATDLQNIHCLQFGSAFGTVSAHACNSAHTTIVRKLHSALGYYSSSGELIATTIARDAISSQRLILEQLTVFIAVPLATTVQIMHWTNYMYWKVLSKAGTFNSSRPLSDSLIDAIIGVVTTGFECLPPSCDGLTGSEDHRPMISPVDTPCGCCVLVGSSSNADMDSRRWCISAYLAVARDQLLRVISCFYFSCDDQQRALRDSEATTFCVQEPAVGFSTGCVLGKRVYLVALVMSLFDLQDVCIVIGSLATLDLPMVIDLIGIYVLKGPYYTLTTTNWFLQALSVIPRGSWGDVARRFPMIRWATSTPCAAPSLLYLTTAAAPRRAAAPCRRRRDRTCSDRLLEKFPSVPNSSGLLVQADEGFLFPIVDLIRMIYRRLP